MTAPGNQEKASSKRLRKNICKVESYLQPRLEELPSDLRRGSDSFQGTAVTVMTSQPAAVPWEISAFPQSRMLPAFAVFSGLSLVCNAALLAAG